MKEKISGLLFDECWESFQKSALPKGASKNQFYSMKAAFYAGGVISARILARLGDNDISEQEGAKLFAEYMEYLERSVIATTEEHH